MERKFQAGELAQIKTTGEVVTINSISKGVNQTFYLVFQNGKKNRYREDELIIFIESYVLYVYPRGLSLNIFQSVSFAWILFKSKESDLNSISSELIIWFIRSLSLKILCFIGLQFNTFALGAKTLE